jgi:UDP:flavonoid glycosyltransferase YjiC (YdhE family)
MRVTVTTSGSRGAVQPYVALGSGLKAAGHEVRIAAQEHFEGFVRARGLGFSPISGDPFQLVAKLLEDGSNPLAFARRFRRILEPVMEQNLEEYLGACRDAEAVIYTPVGFLGYYVALALGVPQVGAALHPLFSRTGHFPSSMIVLGKVHPRKVHDRPYNYLTHIFSEQLFWQCFRAPVNKAVRNVLGLSPSFWGPFSELRRRRVPMLYGWSPSVLPPPPDWGRWLRVTGYWFLEHPGGWKPPRELVDFLDSGPPPVYVGFGSMNKTDPEELTDIVVRALERTGRRGVLVTGWGGISNSALPDTVFGVDEVPHDWLFERVEAAVHHGGAGTTAASLRAGLPTIVVPFFADQPFWGRRVAELGVGPEPIPRRSLTVGRLTHAIQRATADGDMKSKAAALGQRIRAENGTERAAEAFGLHVRKAR